MAVTITELSGIGSGGSNKTGMANAPIVDAPSIITQHEITIDDAASQAFGGKTTYVEIFTTDECLVEFGDSPDGTGYVFYVADYAPRHFGVRPGMKVFATAIS